MEVIFTDYIPVTDSSSVGAVRSAALLAAQRVELDETRTGEFALLATEVSRNVLLHGTGGNVYVLAGKDHGEAIVRILALDKGPGIANIAQAMSDGYSTAGTMGGGMGAMKRIATVFEIFTNRTGTIVFLQIGRSSKLDRTQIAGIAVPYPGERFCGDAWTCHRSPDRTLILVVDGLGHGFDASEAAQEAVATFKKRVDAHPGEMLSYVHEALRKTRGAVAAVAEIRPGEGKLVYAGAGNIAATVLSGGTSRSLVSHNGTLGVTIPRVQEFTSEWSTNGVVIMHSDGVQSRWDTSAYAGLLARHPAVIGGVLLRDFRRQRDDASVVVAKGA